MDQRVRIAVAGAVLIGGLAISLLFRHPGGQSDVPIPGGDQLTLRKRDWPPAAPGGSQNPPGQAANPAAGRAGESLPAPTLLKPAETESGPPDLARVYPGNGAQATSRWGVSMGMGLPENGRPPAAQAHKIADGDTLAALAEKYLGSAGRAMEIFEANRSVLSSPQLLPIGAQLKLPPQQASLAPPTQPAERPLVPVGP